MNDLTELLIDLAVIAVFIGGISQFRTPAGARRGNLTAGLAFAIALALVVYRNTFGDVWVVVLAFAVGGGLGYLISSRINMTQIPSLVAFQNGAGGGAACLVSFVELTRAGSELSALNSVFGYVGLVVGGATLAGSIVAGGKLATWFKQQPVVLPGHNAILLLLIAAGVALAAISGTAAAALPVAGIAIAALALGAIFAIRVGGADMPVLISFLNTCSGLAAAFVGVAVGNQMLIAAGAMVGSSGLILTLVMARAMNRRVGNILTGGHMTAPDAAGPAPADSPEVEVPVEAAATAEPLVSPEPEAPVAEAASPLERARALLAGASSVIIVPGYGMALAQAQAEVATLATALEAEGKQVRFAVHPVAGRMPGHMHVLLAEAEVEYDKLFEMDAINDDFASTDAVLVVGACDVVNPAAITVEGTPISGMPILNVHEAKSVIVCNLDEKPGYSGVPNPLYDEPQAVLLFGNAKETVAELSGDEA
ncbi:MAG: NAD(P)(+) transhydrogenase (Re/Si-specific) subunit beta [Anaerosomatales bacterium]|nr:NAD(P)(+) transhydrogenase (Re/Si-specific) subunit beta [Coriobacteriia bacterium]